MNVSYLISLNSNNFILTTFLYFFTLKFVDFDIFDDILVRVMYKDFEQLMF